MTKMIGHRLAAWALALALGIPFAALAKENNPPAQIKLDQGDINRDARSGNSYSSVVKKVTPSVVNIYSTKTLKAPRFQQYFNDPFLGQLFGGGGGGGRGNQRKLTEESLGSGVIVTADGYILTNNHVVDGADRDGVEVALANGKQKFTAKVIGTDPQTDIAVLKVDAKDLPAIAIADSDKLEVGDVVLAVGNPFGVGQSVSMGIVSGLGRGGFNITDYEDFIQTDAAINPGNSGGALVDAEGRLVGINQSILSRSGANAGVGFAVPINMARSVMDQLVESGTVKRGFLGVMIQAVTPELAQAFKLSDTSGALVGGVSPNTPAEKAGIKEGDVITQVNGKKATDSQHARLLISQNAPGAKVELTIVRDGKERTLTAKLDKIPNEQDETPGGSDLGSSSEYDGLDGVGVEDLDAQTRRQLGVPSYVHGALVSSVDQDSNAYAAGLRQGVVLQEIDRKPIENADEAVKLSEQARGDRLTVRVWSRQNGMSGSRFLSVDNKKKQ
jgi:serine protease Do